MNKPFVRNLIGILLICRALVFNSRGFAEEKIEKKPFVQGASLDVSLASEYLAGKAGFKVVNHPVIQNYFDISTSLGTFYEWGNKRIGEGDINELDFGWISPVLTNGLFGANLNISAYTYPNSQVNWHRWDLETGGNIFTKSLPVNLNLYAAKNFAENKPSHIFKLTAGKNLSLRGLSNRLQDINLFLEGGLAYGDKYYSDYSGFSHATIKCELSKELNKKMQVYASIITQMKLSSFGGRINDELVGIAGLRFNFR